jgi:hypothetical protein
MQECTATDSPFRISRFGQRIVFRKLLTCRRIRSFRNRNESLWTVFSGVARLAKVADSYKKHGRPSHRPYIPEPDSPFETGPRHTHS